jgi:hypothetical protein
MNASPSVFLTGVALLSMLCLSAQGTQPPRPIDYFLLDSRDHPFVVKMFNEKRRVSKGKVIVEPPMAVGYRSNGRGGLTELWRSKGWEGGWFLAKDGENIVTLGPREQAHDRKGLSDVAVSFRWRGKLFKAYTVGELIKRPERLVDVQGDRYEWLPHLQLAPNGFTEDDRFHLVLIDGSTYDFDYRTGEIARITLNAPVRNVEDAFADQRIADTILGGDLYKKSAFRRSFEPHFDLFSTAIVGERDGDLRLQPTQWKATLVAKKQYARRCIVEAILPVGDAGIATSVTPAQIERAFERALAHPFVTRLLEGQSIGLRLQLGEDFLFWERYELEVALLKLKNEPADDRALAHWANLGVYFKSGDSDPFFLNTETAEIITTIDSELVLLNPQGSVIAKEPPRPSIRR